MKPCILKSSVLAAIFLKVDKGFYSRNSSLALHLCEGFKGEFWAPLKTIALLFIFC